MSTIKNTFCLASLVRRRRKAMKRSTLSAPSYSMKRIRPRLETAEIRLWPIRLAARAITGLLPFGAQLRPIWSWLEIPVSSPQ